MKKCFCKLATILVDTRLVKLVKFCWGGSIGRGKGSILPRNKKTQITFPILLLSAQQGFSAYREPEAQGYAPSSVKSRVWLACSGIHT